MAEQTLFHEEGVLVTTSRLEAAGKMHPIRAIGSVRIEPDPEKALAAFSGLVVAGVVLGCIAGLNSSAAVGWIVLSLFFIAAIIALCMLVMSKLVLTVSSADVNVIGNRSKAFLERVMNAVRDAVARQA